MPALLDEACGNDQAFRSHVDDLLRMHAQSHPVVATRATDATTGETTKEASDPLIGQTFGHYEGTARLGAGGMGVVYLARDLRLQRLVALKFLPAHLTMEEEQKIRFLREAKASAALEHPNIGAIHEIDESPDGRLFIVMGYYQGDTVKQRIGRGPLAVNEVVDIGRQVAAGLRHAHSRDVVHRDVKPGNILVTSEGARSLILAREAGWSLEDHEGRPGHGNRGVPLAGTGARGGGGSADRRLGAGCGAVRNAHRPGSFPRSPSPGDHPRDSHGRSDAAEAAPPRHPNANRPDYCSGSAEGPGVSIPIGRRGSEGSHRVSVHSDVV